MSNIIDLISNIQNLIFNHVTEDYYPILRLVCKKWYKLLQNKNYRCSLIKLMETASLELIKYLEFHGFTDYSNYDYFINLCSSEFDKEKFEYLKSKGTPLTHLCYDKAIQIRNVNTIQWLYDNLCPISDESIYMNIYWSGNDDNDINLINLIERVGIRIKFNLYHKGKI